MSVSQKVLVLGLGASGRTAARFYASRGFEVLAADTRPQPPRLDELQKEIPNLKFLGGAVSPVIVAEVSEVMISPGLSPEYSVFAPAVKEAKHRGIAVVGEIELFARELKNSKLRQATRPRSSALPVPTAKPRPPCFQRPSSQRPANPLLRQAMSARTPWASWKTPPSRNTA